MNDNIRVITISGVYKGPEQIRKPSASFAKGRTIRKLMGWGGGGAGEVQRKKFAQGKIK